MVHDPASRLYRAPEHVEGENLQLEVVAIEILLWGIIRRWRKCLEILLCLGRLAVSIVELPCPFLDVAVFPALEGKPGRAKTIASPQIQALIAESARLDIAMRSAPIGRVSSPVEARWVLGLTKVIPEDRKPLFEIKGPVDRNVGVRHGRVGESYALSHGLGLPWQVSSAPRLARVRAT